MSGPAFKFLAQGGKGPISGFPWPLPDGAAPGAWVEASGALVQCSRGVHVCRASDLPYWLHDELWELETDGDELEGLDCRVVRRARLVQQVMAWDRLGATRFADACIDHAAAVTGAQENSAAQALIEDAKQMTRYGYVAIAVFSTAVAVAKVGSGDDRAFRDERRWQAEWLTREVIGAARH